MLLLNGESVLSLRLSHPPPICLHCLFLAGDSLLLPKLLLGEALESSLGFSGSCFSELSWAPIWPAEICVKYSVVSLLRLPSKALCSLPSPPPLPGCGAHPRKMETLHHSTTLSSILELALKAKHLLARLHFTSGTKLGLG